MITVSEVITEKEKDEIIAEVTEKTQDSCFVITFE